MNLDCEVAHIAYNVDLHYTENFIKAMHRSILNFKPANIEFLNLDAVPLLIFNNCLQFGNCGRSNKLTKDSKHIILHMRITIENGLLIVVETSFLDLALQRRRFHDKLLDL